MASFRRTLSPAYHDRTYQNGNVSSPLSSSPSQKFFTKSTPPSNSLFPLYKFLSSIPPSKRHPFPRSFFYRCLVFFLLGFFLDIFLFNHVDNNAVSNDNVKFNSDLSFEIKPLRVNVQLDDGGKSSIKHDNLATVSLSYENDAVLRKQLIVITPTYNRALQAYFLNRLAQVLKLVKPPLLWIVVEMKAQSIETAKFLRKTGVMYRHLVCDRKNFTNVKDRGVYQRNVGLEHIEKHKLDGIVYFADDDNVYSIELFESLREISRFGTWPVAMLAQSKNKAILEGPVCNGTQVIGWHTNEKSKRLRRFHVDMSGFAFNSTIVWDPKRWRRPFSNPIQQLDTVKEGFQETTFIEQVVEDESQMEGVPPGCSRVPNWHLHLDAHGLDYPKGWVFQKNLDVNLPIQ